MITRIVGVDPGLVHTGLAGLVFDPENKTLETFGYAVNGIDPQKAKAYVGLFDHAFIEDFRVRGSYATNSDMIAGVRDYAREFKGSKVLDNTGVKKIISEKLLRAMGLHSFKQATNHNDIKSAARIALFGMAKNPELNTVLATFVEDQINSVPWNITNY